MNIRCNVIKISGVCIDSLVTLCLKSEQNMSSVLSLHSLDCVCLKAPRTFFVSCFVQLQSGQTEHRLRSTFLLRKKHIFLSKLIGLKLSTNLLLFLKVNSLSHLSTRFVPHVPAGLP